jgi:hypothetical protein
MTLGIKTENRKPKTENHPLPLHHLHVQPAGAGAVEFAEKDALPGAQH